MISHNVTSNRDGEDRLTAISGMLKRHFRLTIVLTVVGIAVIFAVSVAVINLGLEMSSAENVAGLAPLVQVMSGTVVVALLGYLGMQRLAHVDTETNVLRNEVRAEVEKGADKTKELVMAKVQTEVRERFEEHRIHIDQQKGEFDALHKQSLEQLHRIQDQLKKLIDAHKWLSTPDGRNALTDFDNPTSVDHAHQLAEKARRNGDKIIAIQALKQISSKRLAGDYQSFHNALSEALRLQDPALAKEIIEHGLTIMPNNHVLKADFAHALKELGQVGDAADYLFQWWRQDPVEFARDWRASVFLADSVKALAMRPDVLQELQEALTFVTEQLPYEVKPWHELAEFHIMRSEHDEAEEVLRKGSMMNPYSQQLHYVLGKLLLQRGRADEAVFELEQALSMDFQDQFQHDVSQGAVWCTFAQACEMIGDYKRAAELYEMVSSSTDVHHQLVSYARNRLQVLAWKQAIPVDRVLTQKPADDLMERLKSVLGELSVDD